LELSGLPQRGERAAKLFRPLTMVADPTSNYISDVAFGWFGAGRVLRDILNLCLRLALPNKPNGSIFWHDEFLHLDNA
jgi:hypothetical protein